MSKKPFEKFIRPEIKGAKKKEAIRQQKRKLKEEARLRGEEFRRKEAEKYQAVGTKYGNTPEQRGKAAAANKPSAGNARYETKGTKYESRQAENNRKQETSIQHPASATQSADMPLNKFIAHAGICGRREAADLVRDGKVTVNGDIIYEPGYKVRGNEDVKVNGKKIFSQKNLVYLLLNKPKDYLTTLKDPEGRKTVMDLIKAATKERVYPVGRLDRNTTGVLILTNDGELAQKLTHPSFEIKKIYEVKLDKPVAKADMDAIVKGITLEDGFIKADAVSYVDTKDKSLVGIEIHSGRNRIVRRIFEHLGYDVRNLDRVMFANLTKKNVDRGKWRYLNEKEVRLLKYMNQSFIRAKKERDEDENAQVEEVLRGDNKLREKKREGGKERRSEQEDVKSKGERPFKRSADSKWKKPAERTERSKNTRPERGTGIKPKESEERTSARKRIYKSSEEKKFTPKKRSNSFNDRKPVAKKNTRPSSAPGKRTTGRKRP